jgi:hypothetical protein
VSYNAVLPMKGRSMPKGKHTGEMCTLCNQPILSGQLVSGVLRDHAPALNEEGARTSDEGYVYGHFPCVLQHLGPEDALKAVQRGDLPSINPDDLMDGCLPRHLGGL